METREDCCCRADGEAIVHPKTTLRGHEWKPKMHGGACIASTSSCFGCVYQASGM
jgi:hypothetical protein